MVAGITISPYSAMRCAAFLVLAKVEWLSLPVMISTYPPRLHFLSFLGHYPFLKDQLLLSLFRHISYLLESF